MDARRSISRTLSLFNSGERCLLGTVKPPSQCSKGSTLQARTSYLYALGTDITRHRVTVDIDSWEPSRILFISPMLLPGFHQD